MKNSIVKVENLSHRYATQWAVRHISFEINDYGIVGLLGSNGAGKSTTMNIMCGVLNQTEGEIYLNGVNLKKEPVKAKRNIGFLPQRPPLYSDVTVDEYLTYCAELRLMTPSSIKNAVIEVKAKCGLERFSKRIVRNLSGGYQQRLGIAQAIIHNPKFVVLDEPTNGLDPIQIVEIRNLVKEIARDRVVLLSTHILSEVQATCDYIFMIECGQMVFSGTLDEFDNYIQPDSLLLCLENPPKIEELRQLEDVRTVEKLTSHQFRIYFKENKNITEKLVETSVAKGWRLTDIHKEKSSLDDIFARLAQKNINNK